MNCALRALLLLSIFCLCHLSLAFCPSTRSAFLKSPTRLAAGGFGGSSTTETSDGGKRDSRNKKKSTSKETKLKPKQQWDRYLVDLKGTEKIPVGVKVKDEWMQVGHVRSQSDVNTDLAVARQRSLIAEHAKRLFPLKVSPKDTMEWGYRRQQTGEGVADNEDWVVVDKSVLNGLTDDDLKNIEKRMGFEGAPDPSTGYYCSYNGGRLVKSDKDVPDPKSRKLV